MAINLKIKFTQELSEKFIHTIEKDLLAIRANVHELTKFDSLLVLEFCYIEELLDEIISMTLTKDTAIEYLGKLEQIMATLSELTNTIKDNKAYREKYKSNKELLVISELCKNIANAATPGTP